MLTYFVLQISFYESVHPIHPSPPPFQAERQSFGFALLVWLQPSHPPISSKTSKTILPIRGRISSNDSFGLSRFCHGLLFKNSCFAFIQVHPLRVVIRLCVARVAILPSPPEHQKPSCLSVDGYLRTTASVYLGTSRT
jgi:hypothetical protein